ncbi:hypothetical protein K402DRAFT_466651 [Aulographum hederae CBS 113979]|uniref:Uncharacterized protein n=1 Tax=Aulographum hederae CBS 113979 TaxID=1176131 RepID=A0A6G1GNX1_9PEZI|nr:hypothetical protein K402DRAFT_466651 [Aulographum hederae CBS 113979]
MEKRDKSFVINQSSVFRRSKQAKTYFHATKVLKTMQLEGKDAHNLRRIRSEAYNHLLREFTQTVKIMFCTNTSAAHRTIQDVFEPKILVVDKAGLSTLADGCVPLAAFKNNMQLVIVAGNHDSERPMAFSFFKNEACSWGKKSFLDRLATAKDRGVSIEVQTLDKQYVTDSVNPRKASKDLCRLKDLEERRMKSSRGGRGGRGGSGSGGSRGGKGAKRGGKGGAGGENGASRGGKGTKRGGKGGTEG